MSLCGRNPQSPKTYEKLGKDPTADYKLQLYALCDRLREECIVYEKLQCSLKVEDPMYYTHCPKNWRDPLADLLCLARGLSLVTQSFFWIKS